jgi:nitrate/nitrite transporter NarK
MLLQGVWLPLHGYSYESTPFWAGVYMLPLTAGFILLGPISGWLSDKYGARWIGTMGMLMVSTSFIILALLPYNFDYWQFAIALLLMGMGNGMFAAPNTVSIMNSVPPEERGVASGMRSTLYNTAQTVSMTMFFTVIIVSLTKQFPPALAGSLSTAGAPQLISAMSNIPPTTALFAAFLGYNPVQMLLSGLPAATYNSISSTTLSTLTGITWFPHTLAQAFLPSLQLSFFIGAVLCFIAAVLSAMRGERYVHGVNGKNEEKIMPELVEGDKKD